MRGLLILGGAYAGLWLLMLLPGAALLLRRVPATALPDDDPALDAWVGRLRRELDERAGPGRTKASGLPFEPVKGRAKSQVSPEAIRVGTSVAVPEDTLLRVGLIVQGGFRCGEGSRLLAPVRATGSAELEPRSQVAALIVGGDLRLQGAHVLGNVSSGGDIVLEEGSRIGGVAVAAGTITLHPGASVGSAVAPLVRGAPDGAEVLPRAPEHKPLGEVRWTEEADAALEEIWPEGRLTEMTEQLEERTGLSLRPVQVLRRARELGLFARGVPRRPAMLGRRAAWVLTPEVVRVGADLRVPEGERVGYGLVVEGALEVFTGAELEAPARSGRGLLVHSGAAIYGQAVSDGLVVCEEAAAIFGPVDSSLHILLFANSRLGLEGFGGANAKGAIGLEPGAEVYGGAIAGMGVRGEALRPGRIEEFEAETAAAAEPAESPEPAMSSEPARGRRRRKPSKGDRRPRKRSRGSRREPAGRPVETPDGSPEELAELSQQPEEEPAD